MVTKPALELRVEYWPIAKLRPYDKNPRVHPEEQIEELVALIGEFGFLVPILVVTRGPDLGILAGHGRLEAANRRGMTEIPVIRCDHLDESQRRALIIAENNASKKAGWDLDVLQEEIEALELDCFDLDLLGFSLPELEEITIGTKPPRRIRTRSPAPGLRLDAPAGPAPVTTKLPPGPAPAPKKGKAKDPSDLIECPNCSHRFPPGKVKVR